MQIVENWSRVRGRVVTWTPPRGDAPAVLRLHVTQVESVRRRDGRAFANLLADACDRSVDIQVPPRAAATLDLATDREIVLDVRRARTGLFAHPDVSHPGPKHGGTE